MEEGEEASVTSLLLDQLYITLHQAMILLHLPTSPFSTLASSSSPSPSASPVPSLLPPQAVYLASMAHNLALLSSSLLLYSLSLYFIHYALTFSPPTSSSPTPHPLPHRNLRLLQLAVLAELAHRARPVAQGQYGECMLRVAKQVRTADAQVDGVRGDAMPSGLELQGRLYALSGKARYVAKQGKVGADVSEELFDVEQRLTVLLASGAWREKHCELVLFTALHIRPPQRSVALLVLRHLLAAFPSAGGIRHQLLCALVDDSECFVHCSSLQLETAVCSFAALRFVTEDCWTRGVLAVRSTRWEEGERLMRLALQLLHRSRLCTDRPASDDDDMAMTAMELQLGAVKAWTARRKQAEADEREAPRREGRKRLKVNR